MGSHSGKKEKRKAREAERYWRLKQEYDERINKLEERRRQIMEQIDPGSGETQSLIQQPSFSSLRENCLRVKDALKEVLQNCDSLLVSQSSALKAVGDSISVDASDSRPSADRKTRVLVFKSDGTPKGQLKGKGVSCSQVAAEYFPQVDRLRSASEVALQEIEELLSLLEEGSGSQQILPPETAGDQEDGNLEGMLGVLKSPMVAGLVSSLLTSIKK